MKRFVTLSFLAAGLLCAQPAHAAGWADELFDWFRSLWSSEPTTAPASAPEYEDSLRVSRLGLLLSEVPRSDTLALEKQWPRPSLTVAGDLERHRRLLRQTVLLTRPGKALPLLGPALRVVYRNDQRPAEFIATARRFADVQEVPFDRLIPELLATARPLPTVVVSDDPVGLSRANFDWYAGLFDALGPGTVLLHFGDAAEIVPPPAGWRVLNSPLRCKESENFTAQALLGAQTIDGRLTDATPIYAAGTGYRLDARRGGFRPPEFLGIDREQLEKADYYINRGIRYRAMPGAQLLVMKDGHVVYERAYGHQQYRNFAVDPGDLYDLASVTKAAATTLAVMQLYDAGRLPLDRQVRDVLPELKKRPIGRYTVEQLLSHQTGLQSAIPVGNLLTRAGVTDSVDAVHHLAIGPDRYLADTVPSLVRAELRGRVDRTRRPIYRYGDLNFYLLQLIVEEITGEPLDRYVSREIYAPLGLGRLAFTPLDSFPPARLVPTAYEPWMRGGMLRGYVQDEVAGLLGGVGGHAGLFGNAHDLARLFDVLLNDGEYLDRKLFSDETIHRFTSKNRFNYRALGFDRLTGGWRNVVQAGAGENTFGHLGYSGTSVWTDPENDLVFVLLTNRVHPQPANDKFQRMRIRGRVHAAVYRALNTYALDS